MAICGQPKTGALQPGERYDFSIGPQAPSARIAIVPQVHNSYSLSSKHLPNYQNYILKNPFRKPSNSVQKWHCLYQFTWHLINPYQVVIH